MRKPRFLPLSVRQIAYLAGILIAAALAASCGHVPLGSLISLRNFDLETTDPERLRIAVRHPDWIRVIPGGARMVVEQKRKSDGRTVLREEVRFRESAAAEDLVSLGRERRRGTELRVYRVAAEDVQRFADTQAILRRQSPEERAALEGSLSVAVAGCRLPAVPPGPALVSTYLAAKETDGFVPLLRDFDLGKAMIEAGAPEAGPIGPCPEAGGEGAN
ncbi:hypothetical protein [Stappia sp. P2PMeth1]|uniref:hypothetical protein n=1 Tax=Stappia sp. P2PMeth1 TaxID=2003586 RepID=UPI0016477878|nr:hypothetical protein [Stappia sp. P2PMeth1]